MASGHRQQIARKTAMTTIDTVRPAKAGFSLEGIFGRVAAWNDARITRKALYKLSDRELDDIGLSRGDIDDIR
jgi:uncharacterized protein YjiS (DUF1127 family)